MRTTKKINKIADAFVKKFWQECKKESEYFKEIKEKISDDDIHRIVVEYFSNTKFGEANKKCVPLSKSIFRTPLDRLIGIYLEKI